MKNIFNPSLTLGVEEEYLLVNPETRDLCTSPPQEFFDDCNKLLGSQAMNEFMKCQIEVATPVCKNVSEAREQIISLRGTISEVAHKYDMKIMAASTHPFASWEKQEHTEKERYDQLNEDLQGVARRLLICGMHVHCCLEDADLRIDVMNQITYFLPHLLALSTSSPFWHGENMGMKSYRLNVFDGMPRTGLPDQYTGHGEFDRIVEQMVSAGVLDDATKIWWDIRPSARFPTLEMRITDVCPLIDDAICIAALYQCLTRMIVRLRRENKRWRMYPRMLLQENRWLAQRFGTEGKLVDLGKGEKVQLSVLWDEILELITEDAEELGVEKEIQHVRTIIKRGTSADKQLKILKEHESLGNSKQTAFNAIVDSLLDETLIGI